MAMELEFWVGDGPYGEARDHVERVQAWQILGVVEKCRRPAHVMIILRHTSQRRGEWVIWVRPGYRSGTGLQVGPLVNL